MPEPLNNLAPGTIQIPSGAQTGGSVTVSPDGTAADPAGGGLLKLQSRIYALALDLDAGLGGTALDQNSLSWRNRDDNSVLALWQAYQIDNLADSVYLLGRAISPNGSKAQIYLTVFQPNSPQTEVYATAQDAGGSEYHRTIIKGDGNSDFLQRFDLTTTGDMLYASAANTKARLGIGSTGQVLTVAGGLPAWATAPGAELDYAQVTSNVSVTATTSATANTVVPGNAVTYAAQPILVEFYSPSANRGTSNITFVLYDGATELGQLGQIAAGDVQRPVKCEARLTPTAASHTYTVKAFVDAGTGTVRAGNGAAAAFYPAYVRVTKV